MKTVLFTFESPVGTFWIHPEPAGRVQLRIDGHRLKTYSSPKAAARAVSERTTGWEKWDGLVDAPVPATLSRWKRGPKKQTERHGERIGVHPKEMTDE